MDWNLNSFEPNLKFALELKGDLKTKYYEQYEKAKKALGNFSSSLKNVFHEHQKLLEEKIELSITNEKLRQMIKHHESSQGECTIVNNNPYSEILGASPNCRLSSKMLATARNTNSKLDDNEIKGQKENISQIMPIYTEDFLSDMEDDTTEKYKSPPISLVGTPVKVQGSPILSKRKRVTSKKSNSSMSNTSSHSITSSNDSGKVNASMLDNNIIDADKDSDKALEEEMNKEPLKPIENTFISASPKIQENNKSMNILDISKTNYGKTEFMEKGKRLRQTTLSLKKVTPVIDISKVNTNESFGNNSFKKDNSWSETFFDGGNKSIKVEKNTQNYERKPLNLNKSPEDHDLIEKSFAFSEKRSKLRNKLSLSKKSDTSRTKTDTDYNLDHSKPCNSKKSEVKNNNIVSANKPIFENQRTLNDLDHLKPYNSKKSEVKNNNNVLTNKPSFENQRTLSDETYFSQAEIDLTEFEDDMQCETPPAKKKLLNSFDIIPGRTQNSPEYVYKEVGVRKKNEKAQLEGWDCRECEKWYCHLPEEERKKRMNQCSKHRGKYKADVLTPESFWNPVFDDTNDSSIFEDH